jgi:hypothetical protein
MAVKNTSPYDVLYSKKLEVPAGSDLLLTKSTFDSTFTKIYACFEKTYSATHTAFFEFNDILNPTGIS